MSVQDQLFDACANGDAETLKSLLAHEDARAVIDLTYNGSSPLVTAILTGHVECVTLLLEHGADVNRPCDDHAHITPLQDVAFSRCNGPEITELLLKHGALINATNDFGITALDRAQRAARWDIVPVLRHWGGKMAKDMRDQSPGRQ